jgi:hypothetical protein
MHAVYAVIEIKRNDGVVWIGSPVSSIIYFEDELVINHILTAEFSVYLIDTLILTADCSVCLMWPH